MHLATVTFLFFLSLGIGDGTAPSRPSIPIEMWKQLKTLDTGEFMDLYLVRGAVINETSPEAPGIPDEGEDADITEESIFTESGSVDPDGRDQVVGMVGEASPCEPQMTPIPIEDATDPSILFWPSCVKVRRCGGCCGHDMLTCKPIRETVQEIQLMKVQYPYAGAPDFEFLGLEQYYIAEHLECECGCRTELSHCDLQIHSYNSESCSCECLNAQEGLQCPSHKVWNREICQCLCPKLTWCAMDSYYSNDTCRCELRPTLESMTALPTTAAEVLDPCENFYCRQGLVAVYVRGQCRCQRAKRRIPIEPRDDPGMVRVPDHPMYHHLKRRAVQP